MKNKLLYSLLIASAVFLAGCPAKNTEQVAVVLAQVDVAYPVNRSVEIWDEFTATIEGEKSVDMRSRVNGYLEKIHFKDGDYVEKGQLLFEIDARPFEAQANASRAQVKEAESKLALAQNNLVRAEELIKSNAVSKEVLETRNTDLLMSQSVVALAQAKLRESELNLEFTKILAPISGYVSKRYIDEGNLVAMSETLLATLVSRDVVYSYFEISERDAIRYTKTNLFSNIADSKIPVKIKLLGQAEPIAVGYLSYADNKLNTSSLELRATVDNKNNLLIPGMFAKAIMRASEGVEKMTLPEEAIGTDLVGRYVIIVDENDVAQYRPVQVGDMATNVLRIIEGGLNGTERVVVNGIQRAVPSVKLQPNLVETK